MNSFYKLVNRQINRRVINDKVFCIGLHKTGTTTLADLASEYGFYPTHSTNWISDDEKLNQYDFFSDGGSHFDNQNEFDFQSLYQKYPSAKFILQTRNPENWIISKLKHAGWDSNTELMPDNTSKINHSEWTYKSLLTISKFIQHKFNYEKKVRQFFEKEDPSKLIEIDITDKSTQREEVKRLAKYLGLRSINKINIPHSNQNINTVALSKPTLELIRKEISQFSSEGNKLFI